VMPMGAPAEGAAARASEAATPIVP
jgi:hypothetical protein